jgi:Predicted membrane protein
MKTKQDNFLTRFIKGVIIALGFILPGVSGGVLAAILGIYERMLKFMAHVRQNFKTDFLYFLPVGIGGIVGIGLLSKAVRVFVESLSSYRALGLCWDHYRNPPNSDQGIYFPDQT